MVKKIVIVGSGFVLTQLPNTILGWKDLVAWWNKDVGSQMSPSTWFNILLPLLGLGVLLFGVWWTKPKSQMPATSPDQPTSWLARLPSQDFDNLKELIKVEVRRIDFTGINDVVPNLTVWVRLVNASIFPVKLTRCEGYIQLNGAHGTTPQLTEFPKLQHGTKQDVRLTQILDGKLPEMLKELLAANQPVNVVGGQCHLVFQVESEGYSKEMPIALREGGLSTPPEGVRLVYDGNIGRLNT